MRPPACWLVVLLLTSCATPQHYISKLEQPLDATQPDPCDAIDSRQTLWSSIGIGAGVAAEVGGLGTITIDDNNKGAKIAVGITTLAVGILAAVSSGLQTGASNDFKRHKCVAQ